MILRPDPGFRYLADENAIGMAKVLQQDYGRRDITYIGHPYLPDVPRGTPDLEWLSIAGRRGWIVVTRDRRIRTRPAELRAFVEHGVRVVWIGGKQDRASRELATVFLDHEVRLDRVATKLGAGPWIVSMTPTGVRELRFPRP